MLRWKSRTFFWVALLATAFLFASGAAPVLAAPTAKADKKILALCEAAKPLIVKDLETLVNMDSGSDDYPELLKKQELLVGWLKKLNGDVQIVPAPKPREGTNNIVATWKGTGKARIMYMIHFDTVWPRGEAAKRPFKITDGVATGPGVVDAQCKVAGLFQLLDIVLNKLGEKNFAVITVLLNCDEEKGSFGSRDLIMEQAAKHDVVYSMDGGGAKGDTITISARGTAYYDLNVKGRESHSGGAPEKGVNAGYEMAFQILQMRDLSNKAMGTDVNWTLGKFGTKSNVIPGTAWAQANVRISKKSEWDRIEKDMTERVKKKLLPESEITLNFVRGRPPFEENPTTNALAEKVISLYKTELELPLRAIHAGGGADSNYSSQKAPTLEGFGFGGSGSHSVDERFPLENIVPRLYLMVRTTQETMKGNMVPLGRKS